MKIDDMALCRFASRMNLCFISAAPFFGYLYATARSEIIRSSSLIESRPMSDLVVIVYPTEAKAEEMRTKLISLQKEYLIELSDAVIAVKQDSGKVKLNQLMNRLKENVEKSSFRVVRRTQSRLCLNSNMRTINSHKQ
ncbi:hypothetical protein V1280_004792 [Bradyrhizobium sp. AZCC 2230]